MPNTLTDLTPDLYTDLAVISRELTGLIPAVAMDSSLERAALNQTIRYARAPKATVLNLTSSQLPVDNGDQTFTNETLTISKSRYVPILWNGDQTEEMDSSVGTENLKTKQFREAMRAIVNEIEADLAGLHVNFANAVSPAGTTLFDAASYKDVANARKAVKKNGSPDDLQLVLSLDAAAAHRGNSTYTAANTAGGDTILRQGILLDQLGVQIRESAQIVETFVKGDGTTADVDGVNAIGSTSLAVTVTDEIVAGDVITIVGDANEYVVVTGTDGAGTIVIAAPGLKVATIGSDTITILNHTERNMMFDRSAIQLITRMPSLPKGGDSAIARTQIVDDRSGLAFEISQYAGHREMKFEIAMNWGFAVVNPEHAIILGD